MLLLMLGPGMPWAQLRELRVLAIANNRLTDVSPLAALTKLERVDLAKNLLPDVQSLKALLDGAPRLEEIDLRDNPISSSRQMLDAVIVHGTSLQTLKYHRPRYPATN